MKVLLHDFWASWQTWAVIGGCVVAIAASVVLANWSQNAETRRAMDASALKSVQAYEDRQAAILKAIADLKAKDAESARDRTAIRKGMDQLKDEVKEGQP